MDESTLVSYYRVSTLMQGFAGLGMAAQRMAVDLYAKSVNGRVVASYEEVETARKNHLKNRPELVKAIAHARRCGATLVIARLDRLSRSVLVTAQLLTSDVTFVCCDNPHANRLTIHILAVMAEHESRMISARCKAAAVARKARGITFKPTSPLSDANRRLGQLAAQIANRVRAHEECLDLFPVIRGRIALGHGLQEIANHLNELGHRNRRKNPWSKSNISKLLKREGIDQAPPRRNTISPAIQQMGVAALAEQRRIHYAPILTAIESGIADSQPFRQIAEDLNSGGYRTKHGTRWTTASLTDLAKGHNIAYPRRRCEDRVGPRPVGKRRNNILQMAAAREFYEPVAPLLMRLKELGYSQLRIATVMNDAGYTTMRGAQWRSATVWKILARERDAVALSADIDSAKAL